jgi:hypothetical protein
MKGITKKAAHHSTLPCGNWVTVENTLRPNIRKESQKSSTSLNPAFIGGNWVGLLKNTLRPNTKKGITKEQHITQSLAL